MRTKGLKISLLGLVCVIALVLVLSISFNSMQSTAAYAAEVTQNTTLNVSETRIDGWRAIKDITIYGENTDYGCGMTAMAILLQFYNDYSLYAGEILPAAFDYNQGTTTLDKTARANALRGYSLSNNPPAGYTTERGDDLYRFTPKFVGGLGSSIDQWFNINTSNATVPSNQRDGLNNFFQIHCNSLGINAVSNDIFYAPDLIGAGPAQSEYFTLARNQLDNNRPILLTMLSYNNTVNNVGSFLEEAHTVVAYGYRVVNGVTEFLAHSGWGSDTEVWFSQRDFQPFEFGFTYIDAPLDRFNTTTISNGTAIRIDGLKRNATGNLIIPSHLNGLPVTEIGNGAFSGQAGVTIVSFVNGSSVTTIGTFALNGYCCGLIETCSVLSPNIKFVLPSKYLRSALTKYCAGAIISISVSANLIIL